jgi:nucleoside-triphosphatase THEP1
MAELALTSESFQHGDPIPARHALEGENLYAPVVATVHAHRHPFTDELKRRGDVRVEPVTRGNREAFPQQILALVGLG